MILKCFVYIMAGESGFKQETLSGAVLYYEWHRLPKQRRSCNKFSHQRLSCTKIACSPAVEVTERRERVSIFIQISRSRGPSLKAYKSKIPAWESWIGFGSLTILWYEAVMAGTVHTISKNEHMLISYCTECTLMPCSVIGWGRGMCGTTGRY